MALPILAVAAAVKILGPAAAKAAKLAYKMYKKKGGNKTEKKFLSDKANSKLKTQKNVKRKTEKIKDKDREQYVKESNKTLLNKYDKRQVKRQAKEIDKVRFGPKYPRPANYDKGNM